MKLGKSHPEKSGNNLGFILQCAFIWSKTSEGFDYWLDLRHKWKNIECSYELNSAINKLDENSKFILLRDLAAVSSRNSKAPAQWTKYYDRFGNLPSVELLKELI